MQLEYHSYAFILLLSSLITFYTASIAMRRTTAGARTIGATLGLMGIWSFFYATTWTNASPEWKSLAIKFMAVGFLFIPASFFIFSRQFTRTEQKLSSLRLLAVFIVPVISLLLISTNEYHHLIYTSISPASTDLFPLEYGRGPFYFVDTIYSYSLIISSLGYLYAHSLRTGRLFRNQFYLIVLGVIVPIFANIYNEIFNPLYRNLDITPVTFSITGILLAYSTLRTGFMHLVPVARTYLIEHMHDGVLVLDEKNVIMDLNPAMESILNTKQSAILGKPVSAAMGYFTDSIESLLDGAEQQAEIRAPGDLARFLDLRVTPLYNADNQLNGHLIVFRDVTERKEVERKLRNVNSRLQTQLLEIGILQSQLREQAIRDPLTNLFNRRYLEETLDRELARAAREKYPLCVLMIDIDHFKQVNDTYGHEAGDVMLKAAAETLVNQSRKSDFACRHGGEEFVIVMPNITLELAQQRAENLRKYLKDLHVNYKRYTLNATFSIGIVTFPANGEDRISLLRAADRAMYAVKHGGRDHIRVYDDSVMMV